MKNKIILVVQQLFRVAFLLPGHITTAPWQRGRTANAAKFSRNGWYCWFYWFTNRHKASEPKASVGKPLVVSVPGVQCVHKATCQFGNRRLPNCHFFWKSRARQRSADLRIFFGELSAKRRFIRILEEPASDQSLILKALLDKKDNAYEEYVRRSRKGSASYANLPKPQRAMAQLLREVSGKLFHFFKGQSGKIDNICMRHLFQ